VQAPWSGRRAPSTVAVGDEPPMNSHETCEAVGSRLPACSGCLVSRLTEGRVKGKMHAVSELAKED